MRLHCRIYRDEKSLKDIARRLSIEQMFEESGQLQYAWERIAKTGKYANRKVVIVVAWGGRDYQHLYGALLYFVTQSNAQFYVTPTKRRKGVAGFMLETLRCMENYGSRVIEAVQGYPGSMEFFAKHYVYVPDESFGNAEIELAAKEIRTETDELLISRWRSIRVIQTRRKRAFRQKYMKAKKAGLI
jgi:hypothetical protein